jgi:hypothetical protein
MLSRSELLTPGTAVDHVLTAQCRASSYSGLQDVGNLSPAPRSAVQVPAAVPAKTVLSAYKASER